MSSCDSFDLSEFLSNGNQLRYMCVNCYDTVMCGDTFLYLVVINVTVTHAVFSFVSLSFLFLDFV